MTWRYQPVYQHHTHQAPGETEPTTETVYSVCEVYFDDDGALEMWTANPSMTPQGETIEELQGDLQHMLDDAKRWQPVNFDDLKPGMKLEPAPGQAARSG